MYIYIYIWIWFVSGVGVYKPAPWYNDIGKGVGDQPTSLVSSAGDLESPDDPKNDDVYVRTIISWDFCVPHFERFFFF